MRTRPRVSFVCAVHNAAYGGDMPRRAAIFLRNFVALANAARLPAEVIFVEWNRPVGNTPWREILDLPRELGFVQLRVIEVSPEIHDQLAPANAAPFFQPIAKNVGLRRARGKYLLSTDPDVVFSPEVFAFFAQRLSRSRFYRIDRHDVADNLDPDISVAEQLAFCRQHVAGIHNNYASISFPSVLSLDRRAEIEAQLAPLRLAYKRTLAIPRLPIRDKERLSFPVDELHTNASGCFILMHRNVWRRIHGHPQFTTRGHSDSVTCWSAATAGLSQVVLEPPCYMFHQPHERGATSCWQQTDWRPWYEAFQRALSYKRVLRISPADWGLADHTLPTWRCQAGEWVAETTPFKATGKPLAA